MFIGFCRTSTLLIPFASRKGDFFVACVIFFYAHSPEIRKHCKNFCSACKKICSACGFLLNALGGLVALRRRVGRLSYVPFGLLSVDCLQFFRLKTWYVCVNVVFLQRMGSMAEKP